MNGDTANHSVHTVLAGGGELGALMRAFDWSKTPLGPVEAWPQSLRSLLSMLLPSKAQIILFWGPEFIVFYNDAYRPVFGAKHPHALGRPGREAWSEIWDNVRTTCSRASCVRVKPSGARTCCSNSNVMGLSRKPTSMCPTTPSAWGRATSAACTVSSPKRPTG